MQLTLAQKRKLYRDGFVRVPGFVSQKMMNVALRAINHSVGRGMKPEDIEKFRADSFCPELRNKPPITDLLFQSGLLELAESAVEPGKLKLYGSGQVALRFPIMDVPSPMHPHLDGMYRPGNRVLKGTIGSFTLLAAVMLSDTPNRYWGNFTVWPGTHQLFEEYFRKNGAKSLLSGMPKISMPEPEQILARAGDALLCHYQLAHTAVSNVSPFIRYAVFFRLAHIEHAKNRSKVFTDIWYEWPGMREVAGGR